MPSKGSPPRGAVVVGLPPPEPQIVRDRRERLEAMRLAVKLLAGCKSTDMVFVLAEAIKDYLESGQRPSKKSSQPVPDGPSPVRITEGKKLPMEAYSIRCTDEDD